MVQIQYSEGMLTVIKVEYNKATLTEPLSFKRYRQNLMLFVCKKYKFYLDYFQRFKLAESKSCEPNIFFKVKTTHMTRLV